MFNYDKKNWFWIVGGDNTKVYSSAERKFIAADSPTYLDWLLKSGQLPTVIESIESLRDVLHDGDEFIKSIKVEFGGIIALNALLVAYPAILIAVQHDNWSDVRELIVDAATKNVITTAQRLKIKKSADDFNIPGNF